MRILLRILIFLLPLTAAAGRNAVDAKTAFKAYDAFNKVYLDVDRSIYRNTDRDRRRNIADGESWKETPSDSLVGSYSASTVPSMMLLFAEP